MHSAGKGVRPATTTPITARPLTTTVLPGARSPFLGRSPSSFRVIPPNAGRLYGRPTRIAHPLHRGPARSGVKIELDGDVVVKSQMHVMAGSSSAASSASQGAGGLGGIGGADGASGSGRSNGGRGSGDSDFIAKVREAIFRAPPAPAEDTFPPDQLRNKEKVAQKLAQLKEYEAMGMLNYPEVRDELSFRLFRHATHRDRNVWEPAMALLKDFFPEELEDVTRAFEAEIRRSETHLGHNIIRRDVPVEFEVRAFVARSPQAEKNMLTNYSMNDGRVDYDALRNLLYRGLLVSVREIPENLLHIALKDPNMPRKFKADLIFSTTDAERVAMTALKSMEEAEGADVVRKLVFLAHRAGRQVPQSVLLYVVRNLEPSKNDLLALVGLVGKAKSAGADQVTDELAMDIAEALAEEDVDLDLVSTMLPRRALRKPELMRLSEAIGEVNRDHLLTTLPKNVLAKMKEPELAQLAQAISPAVAVNPTEIGKMLVPGNWMTTMRAVMKQLIERDLLNAEDLAAIAEQGTREAEFILTRHPRTRVRPLISIMLSNSPFSVAAFEKLAADMPRNPMLTWPELISWATRARDPQVRLAALKRPEALIEQLLYHLERSEGPIERARERAAERGLSRDTFVDSGMTAIREATVTGLLEKLPKKVTRFTRALMAIESGKDEAIENFVETHEFVHTTEPLPRERLEADMGELAGLSADEKIAALKTGKLDVRQKIALLCSEDDEIAVATWEYLTNPQRKNRLRMFSRKRAIIWALRSRSIELKRRMVGEERVLVEHLLALLKYSTLELKSDPSNDRARALRDEVIEALKVKAPQKVASYLEELPRIRRMAGGMRHGWGFNPNDSIAEGRGMLADLSLETQGFLDGFFANREAKEITDKPESLTSIYLSLMKAMK